MLKSWRESPVISNSSHKFCHFSRQRRTKSGK